MSACPKWNLASFCCWNKHTCPPPPTHTHTQSERKREKCCDYYITCTCRAVYLDICTPTEAHGVQLSFSGRESGVWMQITQSFYMGYYCINCQITFFLIPFFFKSQSHAITKAVPHIIDCYLMLVSPLKSHALSNCKHPVLLHYLRVPCHGCLA